MRRLMLALGFLVSATVFAIGSPISAAEATPACSCSADCFGGSCSCTNDDTEYGICACRCKLMWIPECECF